MNKPKLIILVGVPGSGKTSYAKKYMNACSDEVKYLSSDAIRQELYGDESIQGSPAEVFALMQKRAVEALNDGYDVIYDATNITRKDRAGIIGVCPKFVHIEAHIIWAPIETCIERDAARERTVGKEVIDRMLKRFQAPYYDEGIDEIFIAQPDGWDYAADVYVHKCLDDMKIPHDNPHHTLNIIDHCREAKHYLVDKDMMDFDLSIAALRHDIGKPYVKAFIDAKGNPCEHAHYYQHQCVGAWMSYGFAWSTPFSAWLISTHMDPYLNTKYYQNLPAFLKHYVDLLHEADRNAH